MVNMSASTARKCPLHVIGGAAFSIDASGDGQIYKRREYVFTEWAPTATSDLAALRSAFDTNGDGKLTAADKTISSSKVMVAKCDRATESKTLAMLGISGIDPTGAATRVELPGGLVITGVTTFMRFCRSNGVDVQENRQKSRNDEYGMKWRMGSQIARKLCPSNLGRQTVYGSIVKYQALYSRYSEKNRVSLSNLDNFA